MKTIGLIGGMSWESTSQYYSLLNRMIQEKKGGIHSAPILLWSFDFAEIADFQARGDWDGAARILSGAARALEQGGAAMVLICTNTMHKLADEVQNAISVPLVHIADVAAAALCDSPVEKPILLGTRYTMEQEFYKARLRDRHGIEVMVPGEDDREHVHRIIYDELCRGKISPDSRARYQQVIARLREQGADGVIFGCTEIGLLLRPEDLDIPVFDTTLLHVRAAVELALS